MCGRKEAGQAEDETAPRKSKVFNMEEAAGRRTGPQTQNDSLSKHPLLGPLCVVCIQDRRLASEGRCFSVWAKCLRRDRLSRG